MIFAQGGSNYSIFGIGDIYSNGTAFYESLGGTSIAVPSDYAINLSNPALWAKNVTTRLQAGYRFNQNVIYNQNNSLFQNNGKVDGLFGIFALDTSNGLDMSFGIYPYSSVNYLTNTSSLVKLDTLKVLSQTNFQGSGGLTNAYVGFAVNIINDLSFGASIFATFGVIQNQITTSFPGNSFQSSTNYRNDEFIGYGFRAGIFYSGIENLGLGAYIESHPNLIVSSSLYYTYSALSQDTLITCPDSKVKLPDSYGFGASYTLGKFLFASDLSLQDFTGFNYNQNTKAQYKKSMQLTLGMSRLGNKSINARFFDRSNYNIGFGFRELYTSVEGNNINEYFGSVGMDMHVVGTAIINLAFTLGSRGLNTENLVKEWFGRLTVDLSIGESWFHPFRRE